MTDKRQTPLDLVTEMYTTAPAQVKPLLDSHLMELVGSVIPRLAALTQFGGLMSTKECKDVKLGEEFVNALEAAEGAGMPVPQSLTPTIRECGREIGDLIDNAIGRVLITHSEEAVNRDAHLDIVAGHATMCRGLSGLTQVPAGAVAREETDAD